MASVGLLSLAAFPVPWTIAAHASLSSSKTDQLRMGRSIRGVDGRDWYEKLPSRAFLRALFSALEGIACNGSKQSMVCKTASWRRRPREIYQGWQVEAKLSFHCETDSRAVMSSSPSNCVELERAGFETKQTANGMYYLVAGIPCRCQGNAARARSQRALNRNGERETRPGQEMARMGGDDMVGPA
jgi:hypothetical protein